MGVPYAEVIGDPIEQSKSPLIHRHWLGLLGIEADYRATRVAEDELHAYLAERRRDPDWRGCNVTIPHKVAIMPLLDRRRPEARSIGAVNCVFPGLHGLYGGNTDMHGVSAALDGVEIGGKKAALIGAGGGARAALGYFCGRRTGTLAMVVRDPEKAAHFAGKHAATRVEIHSIDDCETAFEGAAAIVNASPLGMAGAPPMPSGLLDCVGRHAAGAALLDMVYKPLRTDFLATGEANGGRAVDGLVMLIGQARAAFELFFGHRAPPQDPALRDLLAT